MFKILIIFITVTIIIVAQENGRPCDDNGQSDTNRANDNSVNRQEQQRFRGFNRGIDVSSNNYPRVAPIGFGTNFPSQRSQNEQFGSGIPLQFGNRFGNQQSGQNGFKLGYGNSQNGVLGRNQYPNNQFGSNGQNFGSFQQGRQFQ